MGWIGWGEAEWRQNGQRWVRHLWEFREQQSEREPRHWMQKACVWIPVLLFPLSVITEKLLCLSGPWFSVGGKPDSPPHFAFHWIFNSSACWCHNHTPFHSIIKCWKCWKSCSSPFSGSLIQPYPRSPTDETPSGSSCSWFWDEIKKKKLPPVPPGRKVNSRHIICMENGLTKQVRLHFRLPKKKSAASVFTSTEMVKITQEVHWIIHGFDPNVQIPPQ